MNRKRALIIGAALIITFVLGFLVIPDIVSRTKISADISPSTQLSSPSTTSTSSTTSVGTPPPSTSSTSPSTSSTPPPTSSSSSTTSSSTPPPTTTSSTTTVNSSPPPTSSSTSTPPPTTTETSTSPTYTATYSDPTFTSTTSTTTRSVDGWIDIIDDIVNDNPGTNCIDSDCLPSNTDDGTFFDTNDPTLSAGDAQDRDRLSKGPGICDGNLADCIDVAIQSLCNACTNSNELVDTDSALAIFDVQVKLRRDSFNNNKQIATVSWRTNKPATGQVVWLTGTLRTESYKYKTSENKALENYHQFILTVPPYRNLHFAVGSRTKDDKVVSPDFEFLSLTKYDSLWDTVLTILKSIFNPGM